MQPSPNPFSFTVSERMRHSRGGTAGAHASQSSPKARRTSSSTASTGGPPPPRAVLPSVISPTAGGDRAGNQRNQGRRPTAPDNVTSDKSWSLRWSYVCRIGPWLTRWARASGPFEPRNSADDAAIAPDKRPLVLSPGQSAAAPSFENTTGFVKGII
jgi:hypothetical protein